MNKSCSTHVQPQLPTPCISVPNLAVAPFVVGPSLPASPLSRPYPLSLPPVPPPLLSPSPTTTTHTTSPSSHISPNRTPHSLCSQTPYPPLTQSPPMPPIQPSPSPRSSSFVPTCPSSTLPTLPRTNTHPMRLRPNPKPSLKRLESHPHALMVSAVETKPTCFTRANKCPLWRQSMGEEINVMF
ncbi:hypothetical protein LIER_36820 [Lithospermum erythrorhizon]|uniref:Uncharacterized protein n=1 Tax=Lithospermum erythrorhizon TaxID=34254 RepID=A0AAV3PCQ7_LITER